MVQPMQIPSNKPLDLLSIDAIFAEDKDAPTIGVDAISDDASFANGKLALLDIGFGDTWSAQEDLFARGV